MDHNFSESLHMINGFEYYYQENNLPNPDPDSFSSVDFDQNPNFRADQPSIWEPPTEEEYYPPPFDENDSSNTALLNYVSEILMEESTGDKQSMFYDPLALRKTEEMLQQVITDSEGQVIKEAMGVKKNHERELVDFEEARSSKQSAVNVEEDEEITEMFDKVLLLSEESDPQILEDGESQTILSNKKRGGKRKTKTKKKTQVVDFRTLLTLCAQAISIGDKTTARDLLLQIRQQSTPLGDASQRLAHCLANALETRLQLQGSTGPAIQTYYSAITSSKDTATDTLKAYRVYLSSTPFLTLLYFFSSRMILDAAKDAQVLHIIDFGILYGFQWPMFIQYLSNKKDVPKKLRITGIDLPQSGFRPTERIEEAGRILAKYCKRFNVQFEYKAIASQNWETIKINELGIRPNEVLAVNAMVRLQNILDETGGEEICPRDGVLKLIRDINPNVFVHSIVNASFNAPFFTSRFKQAVDHYSALFDMFDSTMPRDNQQRIRIEREFYGREAINVIACEKADRVESKPETYRQWQVRMVRARFRQKPVKSELVELFREKLKKWRYHKDFMVDENSKWLLLGWKGRTLYASSCWVSS